MLISISGVHNLLQVVHISRNPVGSAEAGALEDPDSCKYFRPVSTIRSGSQSSNHSGQSSHASEAEADGTVSPPDSPRRQTLSPFVAREFAATNVRLRNAQPMIPLQSAEYPLVAVKKSSLDCPIDKYESLLVSGASIF